MQTTIDAFLLPTEHIDWCELTQNGEINFALPVRVAVRGRPLRVNSALTLCRNEELGGVGHREMPRQLIVAPAHGDRIVELRYPRLVTEC